MTARTLHWKFPAQRWQILRVEMLFVGLLALLIFLLFYAADSDGAKAVLYTLLFLALYAGLSVILQHVHRTEAHYAVKGKHLHLARKTPRGTKREKVHFGDVARHKIDKIFLGGYVLTKKGKKHVLFFNTRKEAEAVERLLKKYVHPK